MPFWRSASVIVKYQPKVRQNGAKVTANQPVSVVDILFFSDSSAPKHEYRITGLMIQTPFARAYFEHFCDYKYASLFAHVKHSVLSANRSVWAMVAKNG